MASTTCRTRTWIMCNFSLGSSLSGGWDGHARRPWPLSAKHWRSQLRATFFRTEERVVVVPDGVGGPCNHIVDGEATGPPRGSAVRLCAWSRRSCSSSTLTMHFPPNRSSRKRSKSLSIAVVRACRRGPGGLCADPPRGCRRQGRIQPRVSPGVRVKAAKSNGTPSSSSTGIRISGSTVLTG